MRSNTLFALTGFALFALSPCVSAEAQNTPAAQTEAKAADTKPITIARTFKVGDTGRYKSHTIAHVGEVEAVTISTSKHTVQEVKPDGSVIVVAVSEGGSVEYSGMQREMPAGGKTTQTIDKKGRLIGYVMDDGMGFIAADVQTLIGTAYHFIVPEKPVAPGDTWETVLDDPAAKGHKLTIKSTFVGVTKSDADSKGPQTLWKVKQTAEGDIEGEAKKAIFEMTAWLDPKDGGLVKSEGTASNLPTQYGSMNWTITITTLPADKKDDKPEKPASSTRR